MNSIRELVRRSPLAAFFVIACCLTWIGWTVPQRLYAQTPLTFVLALPFLLMVPGPLLAALIVTAMTEGRAGVVALLRKSPSGGLAGAGLPWPC